MKKMHCLLFVFAITLLLSGCGSLGNLQTFAGNGLLYTHTVRPLTRHRDPVDVAQKNIAQGDRKQIQVQYMTVVWDYNAIGEIAKKGGIKTIHYADLETRSILGIWSRYIVHVYGTTE